MASGLKYQLENDYILGWGFTTEADENVEVPWPEMYELGALRDEFNNPIYKLVDGKIIKEPMQPTEEQLDLKRRQEIIQEIRKVYSPDEEFNLINKAIEALKNQQELPEEYLSYKANIISLKETINTNYVGKVNLDA